MIAKILTPLFGILYMSQSKAPEVIETSLRAFIFTFIDVLYFPSILSGKNSSGKSFAGENFRHLEKISSVFPDENFT